MNQLKYEKENFLHLLGKHNYLLIVDIEHTCTEDSSIPPCEREVIEIGAVVLCTKSLTILDEFGSIIRPKLHPRLSDFCISLTGISQLHVDQANDFGFVFPEFILWLGQYESCIFSSWGAYDYVQLNIDCVRHGLEPLKGDIYLDLKKAFAKTQKIKPRVGMKRALELSGVRFEGKHHRGLDDAKNLARLLPYTLGILGLGS